MIHFSQQQGLFTTSRKAVLLQVIHHQVEINKDFLGAHFPQESWNLIEEAKIDCRARRCLAEESPATTQKARHCGPCKLTHSNGYFAEDSALQCRGQRVIVVKIPVQMCQFTGIAMTRFKVQFILVHFSQRNIDPSGSALTLWC